jgi:hypothetical protein
VIETPSQDRQRFRFRHRDADVCHIRRAGSFLASEPHRFASCTHRARSSCATLHQDFESADSHHPGITRAAGIQFP